VLIALIVASLALSAPASADDDDDNDAPAPATISVGRFSNPLPVIVAQQKGFYAAENLTVIETQVGSSVDAYRALEAGSANGGYDILLNSSPDNVANYRLNAGNPLGTRLDIKAFFADNSGLNLTLMARPGITSAADLRGKVVAVDSPTSGFAYVLYKILRQAGLERDVDYTVVAKGTGLQRFQGLLAGEFDATLLNAGFEVRAANAGYVPVATVYDIANPYLGGTAVAKTSWLRQNEDVAVRFTRAYYKATQWSLDPANREEAINLLVTPFVSRAVAEQIYAKQMQAGVGLISDLRINQQALRNVLALRQEFGGFDQPQNLQLLSTPGGGLYTLSYLDEALDDDDDDDDD
jgi:ABC-type nitrate/sulfonate/bicarbonate transport system substrate-binding protein